MDLGFIMAPFKHSWQDGSERKKSWVLSPALRILSLSICSMCFFAEWSWRIVELCLNPVPSYLAPPPSPLTPPQGPTRAPLPLPQTPAWTHVSHSEPSQYSRMGTRTVIVCLHYLCQCTVCGKWLRNAIIPSCHPALPSIRLMIFRNRPGLAGCWNHKCEKYKKVGRPLFNWRAMIKFQCLDTSALQCPRPTDSLTEAGVKLFFWSDQHTECRKWIATEDQ